MSIQTGFSLVNAAVVCAILESISGLDPSSVLTQPRYLKLLLNKSHKNKKNTKLQKEALPATVKRRKLAWFGHATRHDNLSQTVLQCTLEVGDAVVGRANVEWTTSKSGHICLCRTAHKGFPQKRLEEDLC